MESEFIGYVGPPDLHDGRIYKMESIQDRIIVHVESSEGRQIALEFFDVTRQDAIRPEGMLLYSLNEMRHSATQHKFVFVNWDDDDTAVLEICAAGFRVIDL